MRSRFPIKWMYLICSVLYQIMIIIIIQCSRLMKNLMESTDVGLLNLLTFTAEFVRSSGQLCVILTWLPSLSETLSLWHNLSYVPKALNLTSISHFNDAVFFPTTACTRVHLIFPLLYQICYLIGGPHWVNFEKLYRLKSGDSTLNETESLQLW